MARDPLSDTETRTDRHKSSAVSLWGLPGDLIVVTCYTLLAWGLIGLPGLLGLSGPPEGLLQVVLGLPLLVFY